MTKKQSILFFLASLTFVSCYSQVRKSIKSSSYSVPRVGGPKAKIMCPIFIESQYPYQAIGFKMGDPFALTYKFYPSKHWAFAVDGGKASSGLYNSYYRGLFGNFISSDTLSTDPLTHTKSKINYLTHKVTSDWFMEAKFLYQWDAEKISKGLQLYAGLGWQWRSTTITYDYNYEQAPIGSGISRFGKFDISRFTYGVTGVVGFEYSYFSLPLSAFIEVESYIDALADPGYQRFQGGVGLRYVF
jgi:hypothetical protein